MKYLFFMIAIFCNAFMDYFDMCPTEWHGKILFLNIDGWHISKMLMILFMVIAIAWDRQFKYYNFDRVKYWIWRISIYGVINYIVFNYLYHHVLKPMGCFF